MSSKIKNTIFAASAVAAATALLLGLRQRLTKKTPPDPETSYVPKDAEQIWIPPGERFKTTVDDDCSGAYFFWDKEDVSGWQFEHGGYVLHTTCSILPTTEQGKNTLEPGDVYEFIPHSKDDGILLYTNERNIIEKFKAI
tara:strand:- start:606 stop:1025 length:420 start_codon:yes stop_codon:yes gene_type:complete